MSLRQPRTSLGVPGTQIDALSPVLMTKVARPRLLDSSSDQARALLFGHPRHRSLQIAYSAPHDVAPASGWRLMLSGMVRSGSSNFAFISSALASVSTPLPAAASPTFGLFFLPGGRPRFFAGSSSAAPQRALRASVEASALSPPKANVSFLAG